VRGWDDMRFLCKKCGVVSEGKDWDESSSDEFVESYEGIENGCEGLEFICPCCGEQVGVVVIDD